MGVATSSCAVGAPRHVWLTWWCLVATIKWSTRFVRQKGLCTAYTQIPRASVGSLLLSTPIGVIGSADVSATHSCVHAEG